MSSNSNTIQKSVTSEKSRNKIYNKCSIYRKERNGKNEMTNNLEKYALNITLTTTTTTGPRNRTDVKKWFARKLRNSVNENTP